uniref:ZP domain-containing protein n=1 Tax=Syphacia muris TaxID=451379 RepID=A0A0N5ANP3_9BILA
MQMLYITLVSILFAATTVNGDGFVFFQISISLYSMKCFLVEEVSCSADAITVVLNKSDPDIAAWLANPKAQPVVYVHGRKARPPCGSALKKGNLFNFNFTIPYGKHCDVQLTDLEPSYRNAETTIALEDNADLSPAKTIRVNHVFCLYTRKIQTIRFNDITSGHEVVASTGGKPKPKVEMIFRSTDGRPLRAAKIGDTVEFYVALSPDKAYHGISPKECMFSDREDMSSPEARHLTFVQSSCPVDEMGELIEPLANVNEEVYFSKFKTFRFGNQSTVFAHCTVQVCLTSEECSQQCFKKVSNSSLTAERLRYRYKREGSYEKDVDFDKKVDEVAITKPFTVLDKLESIQVSTKSIERCEIQAGVSRTVFFIIFGLAVILVACLIVILVMVRRLSSRKKNLQTFYSFATAPIAIQSRSLAAGTYTRTPTIARSWTHDTENVSMKVLSFVLWIKEKLYYAE